MCTCSRRSEVTVLSAHVRVYSGAINVGIIRDGERALLIDCGDGAVAEALSELGVATVERLLFTHHHRDQACGAGRFAAAGAHVAVPACERAWFESPGVFWSDPKYRWHLYSFHPHHLMLTAPLRVDTVVVAGDTFVWGPARIRALATPGHTDGSLSYLVEADGTRVVFCGDAIYDHGRLWDLHSLQHGMGRWGDYHGFLGALPDLVASLRRIQGERPAALVPSHGRVMTRPAEAIDALVSRLQACFDSYTAISALRHYDREVFGPDEGKGRMPFCPPVPVPPCLRHFGTTWVLIAADRSALVMDCGHVGVIDKIRGLLASGEIRAVDGLWVTHYHDDHVDAIPAFQAAFDCPCFADRSVVEVIADPLAWRLPCISPAAARVDRATTDGESWQWHEYRLTAYHFPGQTRYHGALLAAGGGRRMLFVGDSFAPSGIDDYCAQNRILFGANRGLDRCVALLQELKPTHLFNPHVDSAFLFSAAQLDTMRANLARREALMTELLPWDNPNYGLDDFWMRCHPYEQRVRQGAETTLEAVVTNHSSVPHEAVCWPELPWVSGTPIEVGARVAGRTESRLPLIFRIPPTQAPGRYVIAVTIRYGGRSLPQFAEAVVEVE